MANQPIKVIRKPDDIQVILPMPLPYRPRPEWLQLPGPELVLLLPLLLAILALIRGVRSLCGIQPPPHAFFLIRYDFFRMGLVSRKTGKRTTYECDPRKIIEFRKNQYSTGLWIHVSGDIKHTFAEDFEDAIVCDIADCVWPLIQEYTKSVCVDSEDRLH